MAINTRKHGVVKLYDNTATTPLEVEAKPGEGNFTISGWEESGWNAEPVFDRGEIYEWVYTQQAEVSWSITAMHDGDITDSTSSRIMDFVQKTGAFSSGVSHDSGGEVWTGKVEIVVTAHSLAHTIDISNCRVTAEYAEGETGNTITINGRGFGSISKASAST